MYLPAMHADCIQIKLVAGKLGLRMAATTPSRSQLVEVLRFFGPVGHERGREHFSPRRLRRRYRENEFQTAATCTK